MRVTIPRVLIRPTHFRCASSTSRIPSIIAYFKTFVKFNYVIICKFQIYFLPRLPELHRFHVLIDNQVGPLLPHSRDLAPRPRFERGLIGSEPTDLPLIYLGIWLLRKESDLYYILQGDVSCQIGRLSNFAPSVRLELTSTNLEGSCSSN